MNWGIALIVTLMLAIACFSTAHAFSPTDMVPVACTYLDSKGASIGISTECGRHDICERRATCTFVDKKILQKEFGGNKAEAARAGQGWFGGSALTSVRSAVASVKTIWAERSTENPKFLTYDVTLACKSSGGCPSATSCAQDKQVERHEAPMLDETFPIYHRDSNQEADDKAFR